MQTIWKSLNITYKIKRTRFSKKSYSLKRHFSFACLFVNIEYLNQTLKNIEMLLKLSASMALTYFLPVYVWLVFTLLCRSHRYLFLKKSGFLVDWDFSGSMASVWACFCPPPALPVWNGCMPGYHWGCRGCPDLGLRTRSPGRGRTHPVMWCRTWSVQTCCSCEEKC